MRHLFLGTRGDAVVARFTRAVLDMEAAPQIGEELSLLLRESGEMKIRLDFDVVQDVSAAVLGELLALREAADRVSIRNARLSVFKLLQLSGLTAVFEVRRSPRTTVLLAGV